MAMLPKPKSRKRIKLEAKMRKRDLYHDLRRMFLREHRQCEAEICCGTEVERDGVFIWYPGRATEIHHKRGRGRFYLDVGTWLAVCRECHDYLTTHPAYALEHGYSQRRLGDGAKPDRGTGAEAAGMGAGEVEPATGIAGDEGEGP